MSLAPDRGAAELVFSQPVSRRTILLGKLLGLFQALAAAQAVGFGAAGAVVYGQSGSEGLGGFLLLVGASLVTTAVFLGIAALLSAGAVGRKRTRALALALVVWFVAVVLFDLAALGLASVLPSGTASRVLMVSTIVNPIGAVRTGTLLGIEGTGAFGAASLALFRFTRGAWGAGVVLGAVAALLARGPDGARGAPPAEGGCLVASPARRARSSALAVLARRPRPPAAGPRPRGRAGRVLLREGPLLLRGRRGRRGRASLPAPGLRLRAAGRGRGRCAALVRGGAARDEPAGAPRAAPARADASRPGVPSRGPARRPSPRRNASSPPDVP